MPTRISDPLQGPAIEVEERFRKAFPFAIEICAVLHDYGTNVRVTCTFWRSDYVNTWSWRSGPIADRCSGIDVEQVDAEIAACWRHFSTAGGWR